MDPEEAATIADSTDEVDYKSSKVETSSLIMSDSADLFLTLYGSGKALWADEHADVYVERLRQG